MAITEQKLRKVSLIAGILAIISLLVPYAWAQQFGTNVLLWLFGISIVFPPFGVTWAWLPIVAVGVFCTIFLAGGAILLTVTAIMSKTREIAKYEVLWKTSGKLILVSSVLFIAYLIMRINTYFAIYEAFIPFIGFVTPIIAGVLAILAGRKAGTYG